MLPRVKEGRWVEAGAERQIRIWARPFLAAPSRGRQFPSEAETGRAVRRVRRRRPEMFNKQISKKTLIFFNFKKSQFIKYLCALNIWIRQIHHERLNFEIWKTRFWNKNLETKNPPKIFTWCGLAPGKMGFCAASIRSAAVPWRSPFESRLKAYETVIALRVQDKIIEENNSSSHFRHFMAQLFLH